MKPANNILELIGRTPLVRLNKMSADSQANVYVKLEAFNPGGSVKDRIAIQMIVDAEERGDIAPDRSVILEPTSGNTGIGLAMVCAVKGYPVKIVMPDTMSKERRALLKGFGAELILTPGEKGMAGALEKAKELLDQNKNYYMPQQFENPSNPKVHRETTALEIWNDLDGKVDVVVAGVGTGGTLTGVGEALKEKNPDLKLVAVEPTDSPVLSGGKPGPHKIQGIGAGFIPENCHTEIVDEIICVENHQAMEYARRLMREEGILSGISSGANAFAALSLAQKEEYKGKNIVTFICSTGERYLSTELFSDL